MEILEKISRWEKSTWEKLDWRWVAGIILVLALSRLIPHPPNFTPVGTMAILAGLFIKDLRIGLLILLSAMLLSDVLLGLHSTIIFVYAALAVITLANRYLKKLTVAKLIFSALGSGLIFFLITNFGAWLSHDMYAHTFDGLMQAYIAGIPFFKNTLISNLFFMGLSIAALKYSTNLKTVNT